MKKFARTFFIMISIATLAAFWGASCGGGGTTSPEDETPQPTENPVPVITDTTATGRVYTTDPIKVHFSVAMDKTSVEKAMTITGSGPVSGTFSWDENSVTFTPDSRWKTRHPYTLTIATTAKDAKGNPLKTDFVQVFRPELNMYDVNGDGMGDFILASPWNATNGTDSGKAYLFLGRTDWSNKDLDALYEIQSDEVLLGLDAKIIGDINGDGFADIAISGPDASLNGLSHNGFIMIIYGASALESLNLPNDADQVDGIFQGPEDHSALGYPIIPVGDINGDGLADFVVGDSLFAPTNSKYWLILGRTNPFPTFTNPADILSIADVSSAKFTVQGNNFGFGVAGCDANNDELNDLIIGAPEADGGGTERGEVYVIEGSISITSRNLTLESADLTFKGEKDNDGLGGSVACSDIDKDGYDDIIVASPKYESAKGKVYIVKGSDSLTDLNMAGATGVSTLIGETSTDSLGWMVCVLGDINSDGYNDIFAGAPTKKIGAVQATGMAYIFFGGDEIPNIDLSSAVADVTYTGIVSPTNHGYFGFCKPTGDVNGDGIDDLLIGAPGAGGGGTGRGEVYIIFGKSSLTSLNFGNSGEDPDVTIYGESDDDHLLVSATPF